MGDSEAKPAEPNLTGRQLGGFRLLRRLGHGAMAEVYLADQSPLKRQVAIKVLRTELADDPTYIRRFQREAQAAASLVHANIVQIHQVDCIDGIYFIAQEYIQGQNLRQWITRHGPPDLAHALSVMRQVAAALAKAAEQGIIHRDIKPENIMLTRSGEVKVADFGLARLPQQGEGTDLTQVGMTMGTPLYMSPEQVEGKLLDPRSDIYSFGVTCYHMLAGSPPFGGETALSVAVQHLKKQPQSLETLRPDLPLDLCRVVHKMLAKDPKDRHPSPQALLHELRQIQIEHVGDQWPEDLPGWETARLDGPGIAPVEATQRLHTLMQTAAAARPRPRDRVVWAIGLLGVFLLGATIACFTTRPEPLLGGGQVEPPPVPRQDTALRQWYFASQVGTEEAWRSVIDYFPEKQYLAERAKQQLARIYLREGSYSEALAIFEEFAALDEEELRAFGLAGKCGVLTLQEQYRQSAAVLDQLWPIRSKLRDPQIRQMLSYAIRKNRSKLGTQDRQEWEEWLNQQFREED